MRIEAIRGCMWGPGAAERLAPGERGVAPDDVAADLVEAGAAVPCEDGTPEPPPSGVDVDAATSRVNGIGRVAAAALEGEGIRSLGQLAGLSDDEVAATAQVSGLSADRLWGWVREARRMLGQQVEE